MTKKARRKLEAVFAPRRSGWSESADYGEDPAGGWQRGELILDTTRTEMMPRRHVDAAADDPFVHPLRSEEVREARRICDEAIAQGPHVVQEAPEKITLTAVLSSVLLTPQERRVLELRAEGFSPAQVAERLTVAHPSKTSQVKPRTVVVYTYRASVKLRSAFA